MPAKLIRALQRMLTSPLPPFTLAESQQTLRQTCPVLAGRSPQHLISTVGIATALRFIASATLSGCALIGPVRALAAQQKGPTRVVFTCESGYLTQDHWISVSGHEQKTLATLRRRPLPRLSTQCNILLSIRVRGSYISREIQSGVTAFLQRVATRDRATTTTHREWKLFSLQTAG